MANFIGREEELQALESAYLKDSFQMAVIYGRRRIGKTTLLRHFSKAKRQCFLRRLKRRQNVMWNYSANVPLKRWHLK